MPASQTGQRVLYQTVRAGAGMMMLISARSSPGMGQFCRWPFRPPPRVPRPNSRAPIEDKPPMPKKPGTNPKGEFAFFNVVYEDDSVRSNRRVPNEILGGLEGDEPARGFIMEQDREIAEKGGRPALSIKRIERVGAKKK
jgi:hypothetical protein